jgi:hypothetical protein
MKWWVNLGVDPMSFPCLSHILGIPSLAAYLALNGPMKSGLVEEFGEIWPKIPISRKKHESWKRKAPDKVLAPTAIHRCHHPSREVTINAIEDEI